MSTTTRGGGRGAPGPGSGAGGPGPASFVEGKAVGVDVHAIERDLAALWRESSSAERPVARACLWNLLFVTDGDEAHAAARALVDATVASCPARVLHLEARVDEGPPLEAWASANCQLAPGGGKLLCSEEITLVARPDGAHHVPALVRALLVPDVPAALVASGEPAALEATVGPLRGSLDRVVVDTARPFAFPALVRVQAALPVGDLGWQRLASLRLLFASLFDPPVGDAPLRSARRLTIGCAPHGRGPALLLAGWLAARLGWREVLRTGAHAFRLRRPDGGTVEIAITPSTSGGGTDGVTELAVTTEAGTFAVADAGPGALTLRAPDRPPRTLAAPPRGEGELLVAALATGPDRIYAAALAAAARLWDA